MAMVVVMIECASRTDSRSVSAECSGDVIHSRSQTKKIINMLLERERGCTQR